MSFEPFQNQGIGNLLLEEAEKQVRLISDKASLVLGSIQGMGLPRDYQREDIPDGTGVWYQNHRPPMNAVCGRYGDLFYIKSKKLFL